MNLGQYDRPRVLGCRPVDGVLVVLSSNQIGIATFVHLLILFDFILFSNVFFCILVHDYTLYFIGSPCCSVSYYNYISVWPYYIVIQFKPAVLREQLQIHWKLIEYSISLHYIFWLWHCKSSNIKIDGTLVIVNRSLVAIMITTN